MNPGQGVSWYSFYLQPPPTETGEPPRGYGGGGLNGGGGGEGGVTQMFTHGVGPPNPLPKPPATYPRPSGTLWRCILTTWLTITQSYDTHLNESLCVWGYQPFDWKRRDVERPPLTPSAHAMNPASRDGQTTVSHLKAWKNGDHLTRKRQDFWTFNLPHLLLCFHHNNCSQISWCTVDGHARMAKAQRSHWQNLWK